MALGSCHDDAPSGRFGSLRVTGRILVGVDGSDGSHRALSWAIAEARVRGSLVQAVTVWRSPYDPDEMENLWVELGPDRAERIETVENGRLASRARARSEATLAEVAGEDPGIEIEPTILSGDPASTLCRLSASADLLVVGTRGHGGVAGLVLGSVSTECAHHSRCPVVIVPKPGSEIDDS